MGTDKKEVLGYMTGMLIDDQDEAAPPSLSDLNLVSRKGEFLPPIEKLAEIINAAKEEGDLAPEHGVIPDTKEEEGEVPIEATVKESEEDDAIRAIIEESKREPLL